MCEIHDIMSYSLISVFNKGERLVRFRATRSDWCWSCFRVLQYLLLMTARKDEHFIIGVAKLVKGAAVQMLSPKYKGFVGSSPTTGALTFYNLLCS